MMSHKGSKEWDEVYKQKEYAWGIEPDWELRTFLPIIPKGKALDLGIGDGRNAFFLARNGFAVEGIDFSQAAVKKCNDLAAKEGLPVQAVLADLRDFQIPKERYACIICSYVLPFLKRSEAETVINRIKTGLIRHGVSFVAVFTTEDPLYQRCKERGLPEVEENTFFSAKRQTHLCFFSKGELQKFFSDCEILSYVEGYSLELSHDEPHYHGWASVVARKTALG
jgi:SAM-dependent methyltransferase